MNIRTVINNMKTQIPKMRDSITKDTPVYRVLEHGETHRRVIELALALGEDQLLQHVKKLNLDTDFVFNEYGYCIKCYTSVSRSEFFRSVYESLVGKETCMANIVFYNDVQVYIDLTYEELKGQYRYKYCIPMITFMTPERKITITRGMMECMRPEGYKEIKIINKNTKTNTCNIKNRMTYEEIKYMLKNNIKSLVRDLKSMAKESYVSICDESFYDEEEIYSIEEKIEWSRIPESLREFQKTTNCDIELIQDIYSIAFLNERDNIYDKEYNSNRVVSFRIKDIYDGGGWYCHENIASYKSCYIDKYIEDAIVDFLDYYYDYIKEMIMEEGFKENITKKDIVRKAYEENLIQAWGNENGIRYFEGYMERKYTV